MKISGKFLCVLLSILMVVPLLTGCGNGRGEQEPPDDIIEPPPSTNLTITWNPALTLSEIVHNAPMAAQVIAPATSPSSGVVYSPVGNMPAGLSFNAATRQLTGTPTALGEHTFTIRATASNHDPLERTFKIKVITGTQSTMAWNPTLTLDVIGVNVEMNTATLDAVTVPASGVSYAVVGDMPAGLRFDAVNRQISGTPTSLGTFVFVIEATADGYDATRRYFSVTVAADTVYRETSYTYHDWIPREPASLPAGSKLRIKFFEGGYGRAWIDAMADKFSKEYGVDVTLISSKNEAEFTTLLSTTLDGNPDDIYICHNIPFEKLSVQGKIANLNGVYNAPVYYDPFVYDETGRFVYDMSIEGKDKRVRYTDVDDMEPIRFSQRIAPSSLNSARFRDGYWKVPQIQGAGGIAYNKTLFDQYGWKIPETYEDLMTLCDTIYKSNATNSAGEKVYPFVWSNAVAYMWDSVVYDWWVQLAGMDEFDRFMAFEDKNVFNPAEYPYLKQAWSYWYDMLCKNKSWSQPNSLANDNLEMNMSFCAGQAAMMPATAWSANEIGSDFLEEFNCDIGLIPTPVLPGAKKDANGDVIRVAYDLAGKDSIIVSQKGANRNVAIEFLKWMALEENARLFPENANGLLLPINYEFSELIEDATTTWKSDMFTVLSSSQRFTLYSGSPLVYAAATPLSPYPEGNMYGEAFEYFGDASKPSRTPDAVFDSAWTVVNREWDGWRAAVGLK